MDLRIKKRMSLLFLLVLILFILSYKGSAYSYVPHKENMDSIFIDEFKSEVIINTTTQMNMTILEVFDSDSVDTSKSLRVLDFAHGLLGYICYDIESLTYCEVAVTSGYTYVWSFTDIPYFNTTSLEYYIPMIGYLNLTSASYFVISSKGAIVFPLDLNVIQYLCNQTAEEIAWSLGLRTGSYSINRIILNKTVNNILILDYYYTWNKYGDFYEMNFTLSINILNGAVLNYTIIGQENYKLVYKLVSEYSELYNNNGFDIIDITYTKEIIEGDKFSVNISVFDAAVAFYEVRFRLKGDSYWIPFQAYYGDYFKDRWFEDSVKYFGTGKYLMDGIYELNITIWSTQSIKYESITTFTVLESILNRISIRVGAFVLIILCTILSTLVMFEVVVLVTSKIVVCFRRNRKKVKR